MVARAQRGGGGGRRLSHGPVDKGGAHQHRHHGHNDGQASSGHTVAHLPARANNGVARRRHDGTSRDMCSPTGQGAVGIGLSRPAPTPRGHQTATA